MALSNKPVLLKLRVTGSAETLLFRVSDFAGFYSEFYSFNPLNCALNRFLFAFNSYVHVYVYIYAKYTRTYAKAEVLDFFLLQQSQKLNNGMDSLFTEVLLELELSEQIYFFNHRTISQITGDEYKCENTTLLPY